MMENNKKMYLVEVEKIQRASIYVLAENKNGAEEIAIYQDDYFYDPDVSVFSKEIKDVKQIEKDCNDLWDNRGKFLGSAQEVFLKMQEEQQEKQQIETAAVELDKNQLKLNLG